MRVLTHTPGLSQRAWLALTVVVGFVLFTKLIMSK